MKRFASLLLVIVGFIFLTACSTESGSKVLLTEPTRIDVIEMNGKEYQASYFGKYDFNNPNFVSREFWRIENAFDDFKNNTRQGGVLPFDNYPVTVINGQVFMITVVSKTGSQETQYFISDGRIWENRPSTERFIP